MLLAFFLHIFQMRFSLSLSLFCFVLFELLLSNYSLLRFSIMQLHSKGLDKTRKSLTQYDLADSYKREKSTKITNNSPHWNETYWMANKWKKKINTHISILFFSSYKPVEEENTKLWKIELHTGLFIHYFFSLLFFSFNKNVHVALFSFFLYQEFRRS